MVWGIGSSSHEYRSWSEIKAFPISNSGRTVKNPRLKAVPVAQEVGNGQFVRRIWTTLSEPWSQLPTYGGAGESATHCRIPSDPQTAQRTHHNFRRRVKTIYLCEKESYGGKLAAADLVLMGDKIYHISQWRTLPWKLNVEESFKGNSPDTGIKKFWKRRTYTTHKHVFKIMFNGTEPFSSRRFSGKLL